MSTPPPADLAAATLAECTRVFQKQKALAERAIAQLDDAQIFATTHAESNSVAILVKHLHGNMRSRWTDFLTSDGEKPDRARDDEFVIHPQEHLRSVVLQWWNQGWAYLFDAVAALRPFDLLATVKIRGQSLTALAAILRQVDHYGQHVGQIVLLARQMKGGDWQTLSIPRGKSAEFEAEFRKSVGANAR